MKGDLAVTLWETGVVEGVEAPREPSSLYRVFLRQPPNPFDMMRVHGVIERHEAVAGVASVIGWILRS